jgi:hypothetical protein
MDAWPILASLPVQLSVIRSGWRCVTREPGLVTLSLTAVRRQAREPASVGQTGRTSGAADATRSGRSRSGGRWFDFTRVPVYAQDHPVAFVGAHERHADQVALLTAAGVANSPPASARATCQRQKVQPSAVWNMPLVGIAAGRSGRPLAPDVREDMEARFGHDFSAVRIHDDQVAHESAEAVGASAYTIGSDIVFRRGGYDPSSRAGRLTLAHELTHVLQQRAGPVDGAPAAEGVQISDPSDRFEREASANAERMISAATAGPDATVDPSAQATAARRAPSVPLSVQRCGGNSDCGCEDTEMAGRPSGLVLQRSGVPGKVTIQRACLSGAVCVAPPGSSTAFGTAVTSREAAARARRAAMSPARQRATGHTGPARALEHFISTQAPGLLASIHGIFIDQDMDPDVAASTQDCATMVPPITGATKPCVFVPAALNQQAFKFNTDPTATTIGGQSREDWRIGTVQTLVHEVQHVKYDTSISGTPVPAGVTSCSRADIDGELSELNAIMSEFPIAFRSVAAGAAVTDPAAVRLAHWFDTSVDNPGESIRGILTTIRCKCDCGDADKFVIETFNFVASSWSVAEKAAFNGELRKPGRGLNWPL